MNLLMKDEDIQYINELIQQGYISRVTHDSGELYIYNYTCKTQLDWYWNKYTMMCRGLILNSKNEIISRPFPKFFTLEQIESAPDTIKSMLHIPNTSFEIFEKYEGSLGISYYYNGEYYLSTRGSFESCMAIKGTNMLTSEMKRCMVPEFTYLFEIIYPENKIVVDYHGESKLILIAIVNNLTGEELDINKIYNWPGEKARRYDGITDFTQACNMIKYNNQEGFVVKFQNNFRIKIKYEEYKRLHRTMYSLTRKHIWRLIVIQKMTYLDIIETIPDEFRPWFINTYADLNCEFNRVQKLYQSCVNVWMELYKPTNAKEFALMLQNSFCPWAKTTNFKFHNSIMFAIYHKSAKFDEMIWRSIEPKCNDDNTSSYKK